jgi:crotonobetainyl-CoA:carnitine CoA-transferase CaiB-like acyl-CoA transferase
MTSLPLDGITVVAMEQAVAMRGPRRATSRPRRPGHQDRAPSATWRGYDDVVLGTGRLAQPRKESLAIDVASPTGRRVVRTLVSRADVFVQNLPRRGA